MIFWSTTFCGDAFSASLLATCSFNTPFHILCTRTYRNPIAQSLIALNYLSRPIRIVLGQHPFEFIAASSKTAVNGHFRSRRGDHHPSSDKPVGPSADTAVNIDIFHMNPFPGFDQLTSGLLYYPYHGVRSPIERGMAWATTLISTPSEQRMQSCIQPGSTLHCRPISAHTNAPSDF